MDGLISKKYGHASAFGQPVILVDASGRMGHLRIGNERLRPLLQDDQVLCHPVVISVLACGNVRNRSETLHRLKALREGPIANHTKALYLVNAHHLYGQEWGGEMCIPGTRATRCLHLCYTHQPKAKWFCKTLLLNPGSAGPQRFNLPRAVGILVMIDGKIKPRHIELKKNPNRKRPGKILASGRRQFRRDET